jgi:hypothetical protein
MEGHVVFGTWKLPAFVSNQQDFKAINKGFQTQ